MKSTNKTMKLKKDLWLMADSCNDMTHIIKRAGEKARVHFPANGEYAYVYGEAYGRMLSAILKADDLLEYFGYVKPEAA